MIASINLFFLQQLSTAMYCRRPQNMPYSQLFQEALFYITSIDTCCVFYFLETAYHRVIKYLGKNPQELLSPTLGFTQYYLKNYYISESVVQMLLEFSQTRYSDHILIPVPFRKKPFPNTHLDPALTHLHAIPLGPVSGHLIDHLVKIITGHISLSPQCCPITFIIEDFFSVSTDCDMNNSLKWATKQQGLCVNSLV